MDAMQDPDSATKKNIAPGGDLNQNTGTGPTILVLLEHTLDSSMQQVEDLAMETIAASQVPLISSRYSKTVVGSAVKDCKKINNIQNKYKMAEGRFEYGEMNITKLNQRIDDIEDEIYREKLKIKKCADDLSDTFDDMLAHY